MTNRMARHNDSVGEPDQLRDSKGRLVTDSYVERALEHAQRAGRPSLSGESHHSPQIVVRLAPDLKTMAERLADDRGISVSALTRQALREFIERAG